MGLPGKRAERLQKAAYDAHQRGKKALEEGDINAAYVNDQESADLALDAMLQRVRDRAGGHDR